MRIHCLTSPLKVASFGLFLYPVWMVFGGRSGLKRFVVTAWVRQHLPTVRARGGSGTLNLLTCNPLSTGNDPVRLGAHQQLCSTSSPQAEALERASTLCEDPLTQQSMQNFGGIDYYDTNIDRRFRVLFVLGGPGSGKGTQSDRMVEEFPVAHFSVGELLRNVPEDSPHKETIDQTLVAGKIVPVEISLALLQSAMEKARQTTGHHTLFLVDGFPRNYDNLIGWCRVMLDKAALESVLVYQCPLEVLEQRVLSRAQHSGRSDDNLESIHKRFRTFEGETAPVIDVLRSVSTKASKNRWDVVDIDGDRTLDQVWSSTESVLKQLVIDNVLTVNAQLLAAVDSRDLDLYSKLCDIDMFDGKDIGAVFDEQEGSYGGSNISNARVEVITGRQVSVSYIRKMNNLIVEEKRFWSHQGKEGWQHIHFVRKPIEQVC